MHKSKQKATRVVSLVNVWRNIYHIYPVSLKSTRTKYLAVYLSTDQIVHMCSPFCRCALGNFYHDVHGAKMSLIYLLNYLFMSQYTRAVLK